MQNEKAGVRTTTIVDIPIWFRLIMASSITLLSEFVSQTRAAFSFLTEEWGFLSCPTMRRDPSEPRDAQTVVRYHRGNEVVDVVITEIALGIFVAVGRLETPASDPDRCRAKRVAVINFEQYLLDHFGTELSPPLPAMKPHKTFLETYNKASKRYVPIIAANFPQAIQVLAKRFETFGEKLLAAEGTPRAG